MEKKEASDDSYCRIHLDTLLKLKDSTKHLLRLVEEIQSKTHSSRPIPEDPINLSGLLDNKSSATSAILSPTNRKNEGPVNVEISSLAIQRLQMHANHLESIEIQNEDDDCSVYKRLTRKCTCLNRDEFNDFVIHFNEDIRSCTSAVGEIIKNMRILKKFLYMGGGYTKNALLFLNEGLQNSVHDEKVDIIQACSHADICNVFDDDSIVTVCILWSIKIDGFGDEITQSSASAFLYKLAQLEEGRRYLNFSTKISNDIRKATKKKSPLLSEITLEELNATLNLLNPPIPRHLNVTYYCKAEEGMGFRTVNSLQNYRAYMTSEEVFTHLDWLNSFSEHDKGRNELTQYLPNLLRVFKHLLLEYDNSEINTYVTNILMNLVSKRWKKSDDLSHMSPEFVVANIATEPIPMKPVVIQVPSLKHVRNRREKLWTTSNKTYRHPTNVNKARESEFTKQSDKQNKSIGKTRNLNRLSKCKEDQPDLVIVVPIENQQLITV